MHTEIENAIADGRIPAQARPSYEALMASQPKATKRLLRKLAPALKEGGPASSAVDDAPYPTQWLTPGERARLSSAPSPEVAPTPPEQAARGRQSAPASRTQPVASGEPAYPPEWLQTPQRAGTDRITIAND